MLRTAQKELLALKAKVEKEKARPAPDPEKVKKWLDLILEIISRFLK